MKNLKKLGKTLSKKEQKAINGGIQSEDCKEEYRQCLRDSICGSMPAFGYLAGILIGGCIAICKGEEIICDLNEALPTPS